MLLKLFQMKEKKTERFLVILILKFEHTLNIWANMYLTLVNVSKKKTQISLNIACLLLNII